MRLNKIRLQGFRNHTDTTLDLGASFCVIKGANHSGKSSIGQAISMGLASSTSSLDLQGRSFQRKIKRGETKAIITLDVQGAKHLIQQTIVLNSNTSGRTSRAVCLDDEGYKPLPFENFIARYKDALLVAVNTDYFLQKMDENRQKILLAKLALPDHYDFPEEKISAVTKLLGEGAIDFTGEPFAVIDKAYKKTYDERSAVNRQVKDFVIPAALQVADGIDSYSLQKELETARGERQKISAEKDAAVKSGNEVEVKRASLATKTEGLRERCREINTKIEALASSVLSSARLTELQKIVQHHERYTLLTETLGEVVQKINMQNKELVRAKGITSEALTCDKCGQPITKDYIASIIKFAEDSLAESTAAKAEILAELQTLGDVQGALLAISNHEKAANEKDQLAATLAERVKEGKAAVAELNALPAAVDAAAKFVEPLNKIDAKITELTEQLRPVIAAEERAAEIKTKTKTLEKMKEQAKALDELVKYFDKDGIKATLLAEHVGGFERSINSTLDTWGYKCSLSIDPYEMYVTNTDGDTNLTTELSDSEQLMFSLALQCAVSRVAGIGFIVADRMDTFADEERSKANRCLYMMATDGTLEQVILIVTDKSLEVPNLKNSAFFTVKKGTVTRLVAKV